MMKREPAYVFALVFALIQAILPIVASIVTDLEPDQILALWGTSGAIGSLVQGQLTRSHVYAPATVDAMFYEDGHEPDM